MRYTASFAAMVLTLLCLAGAETATAQYGVIYDFEPNNGGVVNPAGTLRTDAKTNLFGTASNGSGFELSLAPHGGWIEKVNHNGPGGREWIPDAKGNFYTTVNCGGPCTTPSGGIIEASPAAGGGWSEKVIYSFGSSSTDGIGPNNNLIFDAQGNLYGTTVAGGTNGAGTAFELTPSTRGSWTEKILYNFGESSTDAINPTAGLVIDPAGNLYGTTSQGGPYYYEDFYNFYIQGGTAFELTRQNDGSWAETILHDFVPSVTGEFGYLQLSGDGWNPTNSLILDNQGNLYGVTSLGATLYGYSGPSGTIMEGTVFKLSPPGTGTGQWTEQVLFLSCDNQVQCSPDSDFAMDSAGNLYGTTAGGGSNLGVDDGSGDTVFEVTPSLQQIVLHDFPSTQTDGRPSGGVTLSEGNLFGLTSDGGPDSYGTAYEIEGVASGVPIETTTTMVASPSANLVAGEPITLTATVTPASGLAFPTGTVTFADPAGGSVTALLVAGRATYSGKVPPVGSYSVYASYSGDSGYTRSVSATITSHVAAPPAE